MDLTTKLYFRHKLFESDENANEYVRKVIGNANPDSEFGAVASRLKNLTEAQLKVAMPRMYEAGYDMMLAFLGQENPVIIGHMAFQEHDKDPQWRMFSLYLDEAQRGRGYGAQLTRHFAQHARDLGIRTIQLGAGNNQKMNTINRRLKEEETKEGISVDLQSNVVTINY